MVGTYAPTKTMLKQEIRFPYNPASSMAGWENRGRNQALAERRRMVVMPPPPEHYVAPVPKTQQLKLTFQGETPLGDDDFDAAGYNMEGVWDWKLGRFRSPKFEHEGVIEAYKDPKSGEGLEIADCTPDDALPKAILYDECGKWPYWMWHWESKCANSCAESGSRLDAGRGDQGPNGEKCYWVNYWWGGCWRLEYHPLEMPDGGDHELPMGFFATLGAKCFDDRPIDIVKPRTRTEAAWMGGCFLDGCVKPQSCSAIELPDGVNIQLYDQPNFMGYTISLQGPKQIPCLDQWGWNDRIQSVKVQNSIGLDAPEPLPKDRIHDSNWIYPGGPDSSLSKYDTYFNQWDELDSSPHDWRATAEGMDGDGVDTVTPEAWQADVNNLY